MKTGAKLAIVLLFTCVVSLPAYPQFRLTARGMVNKSDRSLEYYTLTCPEVEQEELFQMVSYYIEGRLGSPWTVFTARNPDSFTVNAIVPGVVVDGKSWSRSAYDLEFRMMLDIGNGVVRIWMPEIISMTCLKEEEIEGSVNSDETVSGISVRIGQSQDKVRIARLFVSEKYIPGKAGQYRSGGKVIYNKRGKLKNRYAKESLEDYFNYLVDSLEEYINLRQDL